MGGGTIELMHMEKITQSFIKDAREYFSGSLCGNIMKWKWVDGKLYDLDSDDVRLGCYFEYYFTLITTGKGTLPKDGRIPVRGMYANGKQSLAPYALAEANAARLKDQFEQMGLKIVAAGRKLTKGRFSATIDLEVECQKKIIFDDGHTWKKGDRLTFDLKYSGLISNRWEVFGWAALLMDGPHVQKKYHYTQATQYHYVGKAPFYFLVVSSKNENDTLLIHVDVTEEMVEEHIQEASSLYEKFEFEAKIGFEARPSISVCSRCSIRLACKDRHTFPHPVTAKPQ